MASDYRVADGHDVALGSLTVLSPQPRGGGIRVTRRTPAVDGSVNEQGKYVELVWDMLADATAYQSLLTTFGLSSATTNEVTVYVRDHKFAYVRMNGTAVQPEIGPDVDWERYRPRDVTILIKDLELSA